MQLLLQTYGRIFEDILQPFEAMHSGDVYGEDFGFVAW